MRELSGSGVYYQDSRYLEVTVVFEDEEQYLVDVIDIVTVNPLNANGYALMPEPMVLTSMHGNLSNAGGEEVVSLRGSVANIDYPPLIDIQLRDTDGATYKVEVIPQNRDKRITQIGPELNEDEIMDA